MRTTCPECDHQQTVDDTQVGALVTCEECRHRFHAAESSGIQEGLPPTKKRLDDEPHMPRDRARRDEPERSSTGAIVALVLGSVFVVSLLLCCLPFLGGLFFGFLGVQEQRVAMADRDVMVAMEQNDMVAAIKEVAPKPPAMPPDPNAIPAVDVQERIRNGDFEQGHKGFRTQYDYSPLNLRPELAYDILGNPADAHADAAKFSDHTTGKGKMLMVNGGHSIDLLVWGQSAEVQPGADYTFSLWVASWTIFAPAQIDVRINGKSIGQVTAPAQTGDWKELRVTWNAGAAKTAAIEIYDVNQAFSGNDFALDDISLRGPAPK